MAESRPPFADFAPPIRPQGALRREITRACRLTEPEAIAALVTEAELEPHLRVDIARTASQLIMAMRTKGQRGGVEGLVSEYSLSSQEGVALMCLAEALLRIPDDETRDALIRDKIADGNWQAHLGEGRSLFVNAATWGLMVTGRLVSSDDDSGLGAALTRLLARAGEPVIRRGIDMAMEMMGEQFVMGETIEQALRRARRLEAQGFRYSYDMLGEAAATAEDADRYCADYAHAIARIGAAAAGRGPIGGPGISVKLSALHPRYARGQAGRVMTELYPRLRELAQQARSHDIGFNIDAEEADRLELSLDLLESLAGEPALAGWGGLGFVVQAYGKRCPYVIDWLADLARRTRRRIMVRLVKGAYWDSEIKRAQTDGLSEFPVFTRKVHTDVSYLACARRLLAQRDVLFPQFATHNAQTLASLFHIAGPACAPGDYEFQCLHGMGEALYALVVGPQALDRPCRVYAPVGTHETLLAYLVRRLLENGANSSFVHRIWDESLAVAELARDPVEEARAIVPLGAPHPQIARPRDLFVSRTNSAGLDLASESELAGLGKALQASAAKTWNAVPVIFGLGIERPAQAVCNPGDRRDRIGIVSFARERDALFSARQSALAVPGWAATPADERAACLDRAADAMQAQMSGLIGLIMREAGKTAANAAGEVREAIDFLRYYAEEARRTLWDGQRPLGPVVCISPWNFPLAIFTGQVAAALAAGNTVLAKPAEETPLIAAEAVRILHSAGVPLPVLQFVPGDGRIGATLVAAPETAGVLFTGSTAVAKCIQVELASRLLPEGAPIPLIAETGGQNAMIVDSSALAEQVTIDVIASAFDSAGQRCSALRILCLQADIANRQLAMIKGAMAQLAIGRTDQLGTDIGPVITDVARDAILAHIARMRALGCTIHQAELPHECVHGTFVPPTIIEIDDIALIGGEVFGPVLHVLRWRRGELDRVVNAINATGYGLTFGLHTRIDETVEQVTGRIAAGNVYINRNVIGAVVGAQPFGGRGLSGTGPKAGGPLYLGRLVRDRPCAGLPEFRNGYRTELPGPVGERNVYALHPRGAVLLLPHSAAGLQAQLDAVQATGNSATVVWTSPRPTLTRDAQEGAVWLDAMPLEGRFAAVLIEPRVEGIGMLLQQIAAQPGPIPLVQTPDDKGHYRHDWLVEEVVTSTNTAAAGGNASLMALV